ncbi:MAG: extracellular solute-binding protein, partial [Actinomycetes bacterium]
MGRVRALVVGAGLVALLAACSANSGTSGPTPSGSTGSSTPVARSALDCGDTLREVAGNAKKEGHLTLIGVPQDWANYGQILDSFREDYGIDVRVLSPDASSGEELAAVKAMAGDPDRPDIVDLSPTFAHKARVDGLLQPYRSTTWAQIPAGLKDPDGYWVGSYYGIMAIGTNTKVQPNVPSGWVDLRAPRYKGQVGMDGDPRTSGA